MTLYLMAAEWMEHDGNQIAYTAHFRPVDDSGSGNPLFSANALYIYPRKYMIMTSQSPASTTNFNPEYKLLLRLKGN